MERRVLGISAAILLCVLCLTVPSFADVQEMDVYREPALEDGRSVQAPSPGPIPEESQPPDGIGSLLQEVEVRGRIPVIVELNAAFTAEGDLVGPRAAVQQRVGIRATQNTVLAGLAEYKVSSVTQYKYIPFLAMVVDRAGLEYLESSPLVVGIAEDRLMQPALDQSIPLINADDAWAAGFDGAGQAVAILDTGVDSSHPFLAGKVVAQACFSAGDGNPDAESFCPDGTNAQIGGDSGQPCPMARCEHGTHVAGIAAGKQTDSFSGSGVAKEASIIAIQVFSQITDPDQCWPSSAPCERVYHSDAIHGLDHVYELYISPGFNYGIAAANMSFGGGALTEVCDQDDAGSAGYKAAVDNLSSVDIASVAASGNGNAYGVGYTDALAYPACISSVVSVGATTSEPPNADEVASYSNSATFLDLLAPGSDIYSSVPGSGFESWNGTSMAAPHVAGAWAVLKSRQPDASVEGILDALVNSGVPILDGRNQITKPRIDVMAALDIKQPPPLTSPADGACLYDSRPTFQWLVPSVATAYRIQVDDDAGFSLPEIDQTLPSNSYTPPGDLSAGIYHWRAKTISTGGESAWSDYRILTIAGSQSLPFDDGFESGALGPGWCPVTTDEGRVLVSTDYPYEDSFSLLLDSRISTADPSRAAAELMLDLSDQFNVELSFWWREFSDEDHEEDGVFISDDYGTNWHEVVSFNGGTSSWKHEVIDIDAEAASAGLTLNDHFLIKFQYYDNYPIPTDGYAVDQVRVQTTNPDAPTNLVATAVSDTQVDLTWQDNSSDETAFQIDRSTDGGLTYTHIATVGENVQSYSDSDVNCGTAYIYQVRAFRDTDGASSDPSPPDGTTTPPCSLDAPSNLVAAAVSDTQIDLTWQDNSADESAFHIERSEDGGSNWAPIDTVGSNVVNYNDTGLACASTYRYRVRAYRDSDGLLSGYSNESTANTSSCSSPNVITNPGFEEGNNSWSFYTNGGGSFSATAPGYSGAAAAHLSFNSAGSNMQLFQSNVPLKPNTDYNLSFYAYSSSGHDLALYLQKHSAPYTNYGLLGETVNLSTSWQHFSIDFTTSGFATDVSDGRLRFWFVGQATAGDVYHIDDVVLREQAPTPSTTLEVVKDVQPNDPGTQWLISVSGPLPFNDTLSGDDSTGARDVDPGDYQIVESGAGGTNLNDFTASFACTIDAAPGPSGPGDTINLAINEGQSAICTFTNASATGTLEVVKDLQPTDDPGRFNLQIDGATDPDAQNVGHNGSTGPETIAVGTHTVGETAGTGTDLADYTSSIECKDQGGTGSVVASANDAGPLQVNVGDGDQIVCTIANTRGSGTLEVRKTLDPTDDPGLFNLQIDGTTDPDAQDAGHNGSTGPESVAAGNHTVGETAGSGTSLANYATAIECKDQGGSGATVASASHPGPLDVPVHHNDNVVCTIANTRGSALLEVRKALDPTDDPGRFNLQINGATDPDAQNIGHGGTTGKESLSPGTHSVGETAGTATSLSDYTSAIECKDQGGAGSIIASSNDAGPLNVPLNLGDDVLCIISNSRKSDDPGVLANPGFEEGTNAWSFYTNGGGSFSAAAPGYSGSAAAHLSFNAAGSNMQLFQSGIPLKPNTDYTLSFYAYSNSGHDLALYLQKHSTPYTNYGLLGEAVNLSTAWQRFSIDFTTSGFSSNVSDGRLRFWFVGQATAGDVYHIDDVVLRERDTTPSTTLEIVKDVQPDDPGSQWLMSVSGPTPFNDTLSGDDSTGARDVAPGDYQIIESGAGGTNLNDYTASYACTIDAAPGPSGPGDTINLAINEGQSAICTFTNASATGTLEVVKDLQPTNDPGRFNLQIDGATDPDAQNVGHNGSTGPETVAVGAHTVGETAGTGTDLADYASSIECKDQSGTGSVVASANDAGPLQVNVGDGDQIVCTIANTHGSGTLEVRKTLDPTDDPGRFNLQINGTTDPDAQDAGHNGSTGSETIAAGSHSVGETAGTATSLSDYASAIECRDQAGSGNIVASSNDAGPLNVPVHHGDNVLCIISNSRKSDDPGILANPGFEEGTSAWSFYTNGGGSFSATAPAYNGSAAAHLSFNATGSNMQLFQSGIPLNPNTDYTLSFYAYSDSGHDLALYLQKHSAPYTNYGLLGEAVNLSTAWQQFSIDFSTSGFATDVSDGRLRFWFVGQAQPGDVYHIDDIVLQERP